MEETQKHVKVNHEIWQGIRRKYLRSFLLLLIALILLYFLQGFGALLIFLFFIFALILYLVFRGNWLFEVNKKGIVSGSFNKPEVIAWKDLNFIIIELEKEQIYLRSGERSRLVNFQLISPVEVDLVKKALHHYTKQHGIKIEEMQGLNKKGN